MKALDIFYVPSSIGAPVSGVEAGPAALRDAGLMSALHSAGCVVKSTLECAPYSFDSRWDGLVDLCYRLTNEVQISVLAQRFPLVVGGDHSIAAGTWVGVASALQGSLGLLWFDAHLDAHTSEDSASGNPHGMPLAFLLGEGDVRLAAPVLDPQHVCVIGARSWEPEELDRLQRLGVRVYPEVEIRERGMQVVMAEALQRVTTGCAGFGVSFDVDMFNPIDAPGVNSPATGGLDVNEWMDALHGLAARPECVALEFVEYDPQHDVDGRTGQLALHLLSRLFEPEADHLVEMEFEYGAQNYAPMPVVLERGLGCRVWDVNGKSYLDMMSAYSAVSFGHAHPRLIAAMTEQAGQLAVTSRAFHNNRLPGFLRRLTDLTGYAKALPVNSGLEAVETALKAVRKWGYKVKGIAPDKAEIIACEGNFHGRSIAIVGLSGEEQYRDGFGPFPAGLRRVPYGDAAALEAAITPQTAAFLVEPVQGEGGIIVPPAGYLKACAEICRRHRVLLICDEVQTGLGRCGALLASWLDDVRPDGVILGKALGGGLYPVSAFLADAEIMDVFQPGDHGSTFGGNALAATIGLTALDILVEENLSQRAQELGDHLMTSLRELNSPVFRTVRGRGLLIGVELERTYVDARVFAEALLEEGVMTKDTHGNVIRLAPPLIVTRDELDWVVGRMSKVAKYFELGLKRSA